MPLYKKQLNHQITGNTSGATANIATGTYFLAGGNNITLSQNGNSVTVSAGNGAPSPVNFSAGTTSNDLGSVVFSNSNGVSFGLNGSTITGSVNAGGGGVAIAGSNSTFTSGTVVMSNNGGALTISNGAQSVLFSVPNTSSLSASGGVSISTNGSTISIGAPQIPILDRYEYPEKAFSSVGGYGNGSLSLNRMFVPYNVTASVVKIAGSISGSTNTSATTASANISLYMGIYTLNGSSISLASSGSANNGFQWSQSASSTGNTSVNSMRQMTVPMTVNITPGLYWVGAVISRATTYTDFGFSIWGGPGINNGASQGNYAPIGSNTTASLPAIPFHGIYTAATGGLPSSISRGNINYSSASNILRANFYVAFENSTY